MTGPVVSAGTRIYISASTPSSNTVSAFELIAWVQIHGVRLAGELGNIWATRDDFLIGSDYVFKKKTGIALNTLPLEIFTLVGDPGQSILQAASMIDQNYSFKVERKDGGVRYFSGQVTRYIEGQGGGGKELYDAVASIDPQNAIVF